jgi:hypothetical protein
VTVLSPAEYDVTIDSTSSPVVQSETLEVTATIENLGTEDGSQQTIALALDNGVGQVDSTSVQLNGEESTQVSLEWTTSSGDAGSYTATVSSADDSASTGVTVQEPATFAVSIQSTNSPVVQSETLSVTATIENTGDVQGTQTVELDVSSESTTLGTDSASVTLDAGKTTNQEFTVSTGDGDAGSYTATVSSENSSADTSVTVQEPATFAVSIDSTNSPVVQSETLSVTATIENTGDVQGTQTVELDVSSESTTLGTDSASVTLDAGQTKDKTLAVSTGDGDAGSYTATVSSENSSADTPVTVQEPATFAVSIQSTNSPVVQSETLSVTATIENTGDVQGTQTVDLDVSSGSTTLGTDSAEVTLSSGQTTDQEFTVSTGDGDAGDYTASVSSENSSASQSVTILEPANLKLVDTEVVIPSEVADGNSLEVTYNVTNTGEVKGSETVELVITNNGEDIKDSDTIEVPPGEYVEGTLSFQVNVDDYSSLVFSAATTDESDDGDDDSREQADDSQEPTENSQETSGDSQEPTDDLQEPTDNYQKLTSMSRIGPSSVAVL